MWRTFLYGFYQGLVKIVHDFMRRDNENMTSDLDIFFMVDIQKDLAKVVNDFERRNKEKLGY